MDHVGNFKGHLVYYTAIWYILCLFVLQMRVKKQLLILYFSMLMLHCRYFLYETFNLQM
jgi:hypothetical protein